MRTLTIVAALSLAFAAVAFLPAAEAMDTCKFSEKLGVYLCATDPCRYQSDCCHYTGFWCPETD